MNLIFIKVKYVLHRTKDMHKKHNIVVRGQADEGFNQLDGQ